MTVIHKLLVANRGEIARRIMRTTHSMGIECVAVFSDPDAGAPYVNEADESVHLPGASATETYLRSDLLIDAAKRTGANAIHPGYGFLAENAAFARACADAGLVFIGPPPEAIEAMGSKTRAKELMAAAGVPVLRSLMVPTSLLDEVTSSSDTKSRKDLLDDAGKLGWPLLVKATHGGGGRGMRLVASETELIEALASAAREASSAFGDPSVFLERYLEPARHVEVQILADEHQNVVHLFERECSIQRRHQKIIEESPSPAVSDDLRNHMGEVAIAAARAVGYVGAGTVELLLANSGVFFFLEMNTRLQVEHPVTELVTGLDIVRLQLLVAEGLPLPQEATNASISGHAIEARLYAEDPHSGWSASSGVLHRFRFQDLASKDQSPSRAASSTLRIDSGVEDGSEVSAWYDPMLAKVVMHAPTRSEAARALALALRRAEIHGVSTNRDVLAGILTHPEFLSGDFDTGFLDRHDPAELACSPGGERTSELHALAVALAMQADRRQHARVLAGISSGWRNNPSQLQQTSLQEASGAGKTLEVGYRITRNARVIAKVNGTEFPDVTVSSSSAEQVEMIIDGVQHRFRIHIVAPKVFVDSPLGSSSFTQIARFPKPESEEAPGTLTSPMPASVTKVLIDEGDIVEQGQLLMTIEAMKVEHSIVAPASGLVSRVPVHEGRQVAGGEVLVVLDEHREDVDASDAVSPPLATQ